MILCKGQKRRDEETGYETFTFTLVKNFLLLQRYDVEMKLKKKIFKEFSCME